MFGDYRTSGKPIVSSFEWYKWVQNLVMAIWFNFQLKCMVFSAFLPKATWLSHNLGAKTYIHHSASVGFSSGRLMSHPLLEPALATIFVFGFKFFLYIPWHSLGNNLSKFSNQMKISLKIREIWLFASCETSNSRFFSFLKCGECGFWHWTPHIRTLSRKFRIEINPSSYTRQLLASKDWWRHGNFQLQTKYFVFYFLRNG